MRHSRSRGWRICLLLCSGDLLAQELTCHVLGGAAAVAHGEDNGGTATHDVATSIEVADVALDYFCGLKYLFRK